MLVNHQPFRTIWPNIAADKGFLSSVSIIDQTQLPHQFKIVTVDHLESMVNCIKTMQVRGAPLIGAAAAYGIALATLKSTGRQGLQLAATKLIASRPTAVNLQWAVQRMMHLLLALNPTDRIEAAWQEAAKICDEDVAQNQAIGQHGLALVQKQYQHKTFNILTHCNAGWLATVDYGTALAPIYAAHDAGLNVHVWVDETRPRNQGASLTAWELGQHGVPHTVISDNAGGHLMQHGQVDMVIVGADRVTASGDVCNKIGTYLKALAAYDNQTPFYAAVPSPTIDWTIEDGLRGIEIEERSHDEVALIKGQCADGSFAEVNVLPSGPQAATTKVANPAFDVTPARLVTGIITEAGVFQPEHLKSLRRD
jgi:methylthioribose-1-phosphate isomerase